MASPIFSRSWNSIIEPLSILCNSLDNRKFKMVTKNPEILITQHVYYNTRYSVDGASTHQSTLHYATLNLSSRPDHSVQAIAAANCRINDTTSHTQLNPPLLKLHLTSTRTDMIQQQSKDSPSDPSHLIRAGPGRSYRWISRSWPMRGWRSGAGEATIEGSLDCETTEFHCGVGTRACNIISS